MHAVPTETGGMSDNGSVPLRNALFVFLRDRTFHVLEEQMFKWMRRLIGMVIVLFMLLVILLVPGSIPEGEQLRNVQAGSSLIELAQNAVSNASVSTEGLSTELSLNSVQLSQVVKTSAGSALDNSDYQKMALGMDGNDLHVKVPVSLGPIDISIFSFCQNAI